MDGNWELEVPFAGLAAVGAAVDPVAVEVLTGGVWAHEPGG